MYKEINNSKGMDTNYGEGGLQNRRRACEALPVQKGGRKISFGPTPYLNIAKFRE